MELSPQAVAAATFKTVKRGYDPDEVRAYLVEVSASLESSHQQATAMEARARAAIAKLQDATQHPAPPPVGAAPEEAETISRTLLLAQRTADTTVAEARAEAASLTAKAESDAAALTARAEAEAASITSVAKAEAATVVEQAGATAARLVDDARAEAQRAKDEEHLRAEREVQELYARREALVSDVDALESYVAAERERLLAASSAMRDLAETSTGGFAAAVRPSLTAPEPASLATPPAVPPTSALGDDDLPPPVPEPLITGQIPIVGVEPLVSPMPSSNEEARSMWAEAEAADAAASGGDDTVPIDATPAETLAADSLPADMLIDDSVIDDATPAEGTIV